MPASGTRTFTDPDAYQTSVREARLELVITRPNGFNARLTCVELPNLLLQRGQEYLPRVAFLSLANEPAFVAFQTHSEPKPVWRGVELQPQEIVFYSGGERLHQRTHGFCSWGLISLPQAILERGSQALTGLELASLPVWRILRPNRPAVARLRRLFFEACRLAETKPKVLAHSEIARALEQELIHALVVCLTGGELRDTTSTLRKHANLMERFEDVLAAHPEGAMRLPDVCASLGVSDRTLRKCCDQFLGMSPARYLRLRQLKLVRKTLLHTDSAPASVAEAARRHGFSELSRFAAAYRSQFGELPSVTLRRIQNLQPRFRIRIA